VRNELYARYVSRFKGDVGDPALAWMDYKYLPLLAHVPRDAPILELGCGNGRVLEYLARRGFLNARGIDISNEQVELARGRGVDAECADAVEFMARHEGEFSTIVAIDFFEHFAREELARLARAAYSALQPRGTLLVQTANGAGLYPGQVIYGDLTHLTIFTPESLGQLLRLVGFVDLCYAETGPVPWRWRGRLNLVTWRLLTRLAATVRYIETGKRQTIWTENFICLARTPRP